MSYTGYVVWFILMAILIAALLAFGTLHMAGLMPPEGHHHEDEDVTGDDSADGERDHDTHHHWWHRAA